MLIFSTSAYLCKGSMAVYTARNSKILSALQELGDLKSADPPCCGSTYPALRCTTRMLLYLIGITVVIFFIWSKSFFGIWTFFGLLFLEVLVEIGCCIYEKCVPRRTLIFTDKAVLIIDPETKIIKNILKPRKEGCHIEVEIPPRIMGTKNKKGWGTIYLATESGSRRRLGSYKNAQWVFEKLCSIMNGTSNPEAIISVRSQ